MIIKKYFIYTYFWVFKPLVPDISLFNINSCLGSKERKHHTYSLFLKYGHQREPSRAFFSTSRRFNIGFLSHFFFWKDTLKKHEIYVKLRSHHLHTWWFKAWISIFFLFSHKICTSFHPVSKLSSCSFNDCCWRSDSSWIHLGPLAISCLKSGSRLSISSLRSSCSFSIFSASNRDTGISSDATSFWVLFSLIKRKNVMTKFSLLDNLYYIVCPSKKPALQRYQGKTWA